MKDLILKIRNVTKQYPGVTALKNVSFNIGKGEVRALVGENGAGKSTLIKCIMGVIKSDSGSISMLHNGLWIANHNAIEAQKHGVYANYQNINIAPELSIAENYYLGCQPKTKFHTVDWAKMNVDSQKIINKFKMKVNSKDKIKDLPIAMQAMVTISKISVNDNINLVIFDEGLPDALPYELKIH